MTWPARIVLALSLVLFGFVLGQRLKQAQWDAANVKAAQENSKAEQGAAHEVAKEAEQSVKVVTRIKTVTREVPVYRSAECQHDQRVYDDLNRALSGAGDGELPAGSGGIAGQDDGRDDRQAH